MDEGGESAAAGCSEEENGGLRGGHVEFLMVDLACVWFLKFDTAGMKFGSS